MLTLTELIDKYLLGDLNGQGLKDFETDLRNNPQLQKEVELQKLVIKGIELAAIHKQVSVAKKNFLLKSILVKIVVLLLIAVGIGTLTYIAIGSKTDHNILIEDNYKEQQFRININQDTLLETKNGMVFIIPAHAFDTKSDSVEIKIEEALDAASVMMKGLSTVSDSLLLETAGMFKFNASVKGNAVNVVKDITASLPTDNVDKDMMLFKGEDDGNGNINWVNPQKITQELVTYDIEKLNFFPKGFLDIIDTLYQVRGINEESKRIYFEMSGYSGFPIIDELELSDVEPVIIEGLVKIISPQTQPSTTKKEIAKKDTSMNSYEVGTHNPEIDPSRIRTIWNKKFNKTILATKEFEERLQFIFTTCNPAFLDYYINNLNKPLYYIDSICANNNYGGPRDKFLEFYERKDGGVNVSDKAMAKLHKYYEKKYDAYQSAAAKTWQEYYDKIEKDDQKFADKSTKKLTEESVRSSKMFTEELCKNLTNAYSQIGMTHSCNNSNLSPDHAYTFTINNTGWYNLDKYVVDATLQRETLEYTDPTSGKKAKIIYSTCTINITNIDVYDFVNVYLLPDALSSFQKIRKINNIFSESLNMSFNNSIIVVAKKGKAWYWSSISKAEGKTYTIVLNPINEFQLKKELNSYNKNKKADIMDDMSYFEYAEEYKEALTKRKLVAEEKRKIAKVIFPCINVNDASTPKGVIGSPESIPGL